MLIIGFAEGLGAAKTYAVAAGYRVSATRRASGTRRRRHRRWAELGHGRERRACRNRSERAAGARTQVSGLVVAVLPVPAAALPYWSLEQLPEATLSAVVIAAVVELVEFPALRRLYRVWSARLGRIYGLAARVDFLAALAALLGVLVFDTLPGLIIGIVVSMLLLLYWVARPHVARLAAADGVWLDAERHQELTPDPRYLVVRVESGLFFANSEHVRDRIEALRMPQTRSWFDVESP